MIEVMGGRVNQPRVIPFDDEDGEYVSDEDFDEEELGPSIFAVTSQAYGAPMHEEDED